MSKEPSVNVFKSILGYISGDSIIGTSGTVINGIIGAGILFMPFILKDMGMVFGLSFLVIGIIIVVIQNFILFAALNAAREKRPEDLAESMELLLKYSFQSKFWGGVAFIFAKIFVYIFMFGVIVSFQMILQGILIELLHLISSNDWFVVDSISCRLVVGGSLIIVLSLFSLFKEMRSFGFISIVSICVVFILFLVMAILYLIGFTEPMKTGELMLIPDFSETQSFLKIAKYGGILSFSSLNLALCKIHSEFSAENKTHKLPIIVILSYVVVFFVYVSFALVGYLSFLDDTAENIIQSYSGEEMGQRIISFALRILNFLQLFLTYPVLSFVLSHVAFEIVDLFTQFITDSCSNSKKEEVLVPKDVEDDRFSMLEESEYSPPNSPSSSSSCSMDETKSSEISSSEEGEKSPVGIINIELPKSTPAAAEDRIKRISNRLSRVSSHGYDIPDIFSMEFNQFVPQEDKELVEKVTFSKKLGITRRYVMFTIVSILSTFVYGGIAIFYPNAQKMVGYVGGVPCIMFSIVIPTVAYLKLAKYSAIKGIVVTAFAIFAAVFLGLVSSVIQVAEEFGLEV